MLIYHEQITALSLFNKKLQAGPSNMRTRQDAKSITAGGVARQDANSITAGGVATQDSAKRKGEEQTSSSYF